MNNNNIKTDIFYIAAPQGNIYFSVAEGVVSSQGRPSQVPYDKFLDFLHTAELLGFKIGKL
jgi:hypothetical protein